MNKIIPIALTASMAMSSAVQAAVIDFEGILPSNTNSDSFSNLGISNTYQGYSWSATNSAQSPTDWGAAQSSLGGVTANTGNGFGWTFNGGQSMFIDFGVATDFVDGYFAGQFSPTDDSSTVQFFGYDAASNQIASSGVFNLLDGQWSLLTANLLNIHRLEIRSDSPTSWFAVDDLQVNRSQIPSQVPIPAAAFLFAPALLGFLGLRRKAKAA